MTITWTNCADRMPDDDGHLIVRKIGDHRLSIYHKSTVINWLRNKKSYECAPYTEEAWKELNKV